jgi:LAO/AO transport system kinase
MERLSVRREAFIRPSPSGGSLGGVAHRTREAMLLCEAAGYDVILIETVGIGQSEVAVASMVDFFLVLLLPSGGDELQGIKKGVIELADALVVNKADGPMAEAARRTRVDYASALDLIRSGSDEWRPKAFTASAIGGEGVSEVWEAVLEHHALADASGRLQARRRGQARDWMWRLIDDGVARAFRGRAGMAAAISQAEKDVQDQRTTPAAAARDLLARFLDPSPLG